jgi:DNA-binding MarR family transcriptional regulator
MRNSRRKDNSIDPQGEFPLAPVEYFFYLQFQIVRQRDLFFERAFRETGLNLHRWRTLAVIRRIENCSMKDLALYSAIDRTTLTRAVDQLVREGLVERWAPAGDRRRVNVALSPKGEAVYGQAVDTLLRENAAMMDGVEADDLRAAVRVGQRIVRNLMADPAEAERLVAYGRPTPAPRR